VAHHLIFVPATISKGRPLDVVFKELNLEDHMGGCLPLAVSEGDSPSGESGILCGWQSPGDNNVIVNKEKQKWMKSASGYWVGIWSDSYPTEEQLRRPYMQPGLWIPGLAGDKTWKLPIPETLNPRMALDDEGTWKFVPMREYAWYVEEIQKRRAEMETVEEDGQTFWRYNLNPLVDIALLIRVLRINYRLLPEVCHLCEMFTRDDVNSAYKQMLGFNPN